MEAKVLETFDTGTRKIIITLERWEDDRFSVRISDGSNFTTFDAIDENWGRISAGFLAERIKRAVKKPRRRK